MNLRQLLDLREQRGIAMRRARHCRKQGIDGVEADVFIARSVHRTLMRLLRRLP